MNLVVCALLGWLTIITFSLLPKRLPVFDFVFMYCVVLIMTTSIYTAFDINWHIISIERTLMVGFSVVISRVVTIPILVMIAVNALQRAGEKGPRWFVVVASWIGITVFSFALHFLNIVSFHASFAMQAVLMGGINMGFIVLAWGLVWVYKHTDRKIVIRS